MTSRKKLDSVTIFEGFCFLLGISASVFIVNALILSVLSNIINCYTNLVGSFFFTYSFWVVPVAQRKLAWVVVSGSLCAMCARVNVCFHSV